jgi:flavodoxin
MGLGFVCLLRRLSSAPRLARDLEGTTTAGGAGGVGGRWSAVFWCCRWSGYNGTTSGLVTAWVLAAASRGQHSNKEAPIRVLVTYLTKTGNTQKIAEAIYGEITEEKELKPWDEVATFEGYDLAFVGFPIMKMGPTPDVEAFLQEHTAGRDIALFCTHAAPEDAPPLADWLEKCKCPAAKANIVGMFDCQGEMSQEIADAMTKSGVPQLVEWAKGRGATLGQPDESRVERARAFAREVMATVAG